MHLRYGEGQEIEKVYKESQHILASLQQKEMWTSDNERERHGESVSALESIRG